MKPTPEQIEAVEKTIVMWKRPEFRKYRGTMAPLEMKEMYLKSELNIKLAEMPSGGCFLCGVWFGECSACPLSDCMDGSKAYSKYIDDWWDEDEKGMCIQADKIVAMCETWLKENAGIE